MSSVPHVIGGLSGQSWAKAKVEKMAITNPTLMLLLVAWKLWKALLLDYSFYMYKLVTIGYAIRLCLDFKTRVIMS